MGRTGMQDRIGCADPNRCAAGDGRDALGGFVMDCLYLLARRGGGLRWCLCCAGGVADGVPELDGRAGRLRCGFGGGRGWEQVGDGDGGARVLLTGSRWGE